MIQKSSLANALPQWLTVQIGLVLLAVLLGAVNAEAQQRSRNRVGLPQHAANERLPDGIKRMADVSYRDGHDRWKLDVYLPEEQDAVVLRPAIVLIHGGAWRMGSKRNGLMVSTATHLAAKGYVCVSLNYRLIQHARFPAAIEDVKTAVRWLRAHAKEYRIDPHRIAAFGNSAGAHLASMLGLAPTEAGFDEEGPFAGQSSAVNAVIAVAAPMDLTHWLDQDPDGQRHRAFYRGAVETYREQALAASPVTYVRQDMPPFLLIQGGRDLLVPRAQAHDFVEVAKASGAKDVQLLMVERAGHNVFNAARRQTVPAIDAFLRRHLSAPVPYGHVETKTAKP